MKTADKVLTITLCWTLAGAFITVYDHLVLQARFSVGAAQHYTFVSSLLINMAVGFVAAVTGGTFIVRFVNERYSQIAYWKSILLVVSSFVVVSSGLIVTVSILQMMIHTGGSIRWASLKNFLLDPMHTKNVVIWSAIVAGTQLMLQINDKFGQGVLRHLITGKYNRPRVEKRIFMIVDLTASTTIAEMLKQDQYHLLLRDFFADITKPILAHQGEIYQYVGDSIVVSWRVTDLAPDNRCLHCYFDMHVMLAQLQNRYVSTYGIVPQFKAGLHYGDVIAGEIGIIKRDITYSGDVLNTVSRIQGKCHEYSVNILTSDELLSFLPYEKSFRRIPVGEIELRGKRHKVSVSSLEITNHGS